MQPFPTEKTEKCLVVGQPFILVSTPYFLKQLREWGFETFGDFWDESYDNELDDGKRLEKIFEQIQYISSLSLEEVEDMYYRMIPILQHNQNRNNEFHKEQGTKRILLGWRNRPTTSTKVFTTSTTQISNMKTLTTHGCSFTENINNGFYIGVEDTLNKDFDFMNYGRNSNSNQGILETAITVPSKSIQ